MWTHKQCEVILILGVMYTVHNWCLFNIFPGTFSPLSSRDVKKNLLEGLASDNVKKTLLQQMQSPNMTGANLTDARKEFEKIVNKTYLAYYPASPLGMSLTQSKKLSLHNYVDF